MPNYKILSDSSCDLPEKLKEEYDIELIPYYVSFDGHNYYKENIDITVNEFYNKLKKNNLSPKTSLPSINDYAEVFKKYLEIGQDILCFCLTSKFSGSYQSAVNASHILKEEYPDRKILIIDSMQATAGQGIVVLEALSMQKAGYTIEQTAEKINELKKTAKIIFTVDSLSYLQKGGRIGKVSAIAGSLLNIKPIIYLKDGELIPYSKIRGRKKALNEVINIAINNTKSDINSYRFCILHAACIEDAEFLKETLYNEYGINIDIPLFDVGVTIGSHIGPTATGIVFIKKALE